jgi:hypothetical protein
VLSWPLGAAPGHHFDLTRRLTAQAPGPVLFISPCGSPERLTRQYRNVESLGRFEARSGPHSTRTYFAYQLSSPLAEIAPLSGC